MEKGLLATGLILLVLACGGLEARAQDWSIDDTLRFAADMAKDGNWREASFRWNHAHRAQPDSARILNNLAVAAEALGDRKAAESYYARAVARSRGESRIEDNQRRFSRFWRRVDADEAADDERARLEPPPAVDPGEEDAKKKKKGKAFPVTIELPVPARLKLKDDSKILVASFLTDDTSYLDTNRELVRFLRNEFRKGTALEVLQVIPPPAVPEQSIEDLIANSEFWKHMAREHGADLIVSGVVSYDRDDASGFKDVDVVSPRTGQKIRQTRFVDQEQFHYSVDLLFIDGPTGTLLFRDKLKRSLLFMGQQNDPITAFYELSESIAGDVLAVVRPRIRKDTRFVFKR